MTTVLTTEGTNQTLVNIAVEHRAHKTLKALIAKKADCNSPSTVVPPICVAAEQADTIALQILIDAKANVGADVNATSEHGAASASAIAARNGAEECLKLLLAAKAKPL